LNKKNPTLSAQNVIYNNYSNLVKVLSSLGLAIKPGNYNPKGVEIGW